MGKPLALYIRPEIRPEQQDVLRNILTRREKGLEHYFRLHYITSEAELKASTGLFKEADLVIFNLHDDQLPLPLKPDDLTDNLPKAAIISVDAFSPSLFSAINYFEQLGVDAYFTSDSSLGEHAPSIKNKLYYWLWFVNEEEFNHHGLPKDTDILLSSGNFMPAYQWRNQVFPVLKGHFRYVELKHFLQAEPGKRFIGKEFSKLFNRTKLVPTCGAYNQTLVLKHIEIPASYACLVTEGTPVIQAMGFEDGKNCIFATPETIVSKVSYYLENPAAMEEITRKGYELIHEKHSLNQRTQILDWYTLTKKKSANQRIIQKGAFESLELTDAESGQQNFHFYNAAFWQELSRHDHLIVNGDIKAIPEDYYLNFLRNYYPLYPGFLIRAATYYLQAGKPEFAFYYLLKALYAKQAVKDPIPVSLLLLTTVGLGMKKVAMEVVENYNCDTTDLYQLMKLVVYKLNNSPKVNAQQELVTRNAFEFVSEMEFLNKPLPELKAFVAGVLHKYHKTEAAAFVQQLSFLEERNLQPANQEFRNGDNHVFHHFREVLNFEGRNILRTGSPTLITFKFRELLDRKLFSGRKYADMFLY